MTQNSKQVQQLLKQILQANKALDQWSYTYSDKLLNEIEKYQQEQSQQTLIDIGKLAFEDETAVEVPIEKQSFFSQIPLVHLDEQTQDRILNFKLNFVSAKRKDQLFKRHRKQQQEKLTLRKRQMEKHYAYKLDNFKNLKGEFTLKKGQQIHTCSITGDDLEKLRPQTDLNDTIIANYLKYLQTQVFTQQIDKTMFIYSSFFIQKLVGQLLREDTIFFDKDMKIFNERMKLKVAENYKNVKRWTRKADIFQKEYLIIPINAFKHWYCMIVVNPGCIIQPKPNKKAYIANCDSMFQKRNFIVDAIRMYLQVQLQDKKSKKMEINEQNLPCLQLLLPRQTNTHDCGLYMLTYIEHLLSNPKQLETLDIIKNRQKLSLFPRNIIYSMRERLKQLFISLINTSDEAIRKQILTKYKIETEKIIEEADDSDYDKINEKEFKKYEAMNSYIIETIYAGQDISDQQLEYACRIRFYLDPEVNYYERDKPFFM